MKSGLYGHYRYAQVESYREGHSEGLMARMQIQSGIKYVIFYPKQLYSINFVWEGLCVKVLSMHNLLMGYHSVKYNILHIVPSQLPQSFGWLDFAEVYILKVCYNLAKFMDKQFYCTVLAFLIADVQ